MLCLLMAMTAVDVNELKWWRAEAERLAEENAVLQDRVADLEGQVAVLTEQVATLAKLTFGISSEKKRRGGPSRDPEDCPSDTADPESGSRDSEGSGRRGRGQRRGGRGHGRRGYSHLEAEEEVHDVDENERVCPDCGQDYAPCGYESSTQIDWQVRIVRVVHRRRRYRRRCDCGASRAMVVAAVPPKAIPKGMFTSMFLARLLVEKYVLGRPLRRIAAALANDGFDIAQGTLVGALKKLSTLLAPLDAAVRTRNAAQTHLHIDETSWNVFEAVADKANYRWWLWVFVGTDTTVFRIEQSRSTKVLTDHLGIDLDAGSLPKGQRLLVSSDFFTVYQALAKVDGVESLWCWAHMRRYFIRAGDAHKDLADWTAAWLERIGMLYVAHRALEDCAAGTPEHQRASKDFADAFDAIDVARDAEANDETLHPRQRKVLATFGNEWEGLFRHQQFPEIALDNNVAERTLRNPVVGRKNYYGSGSVSASELSGRVWTVTATAAQAGINPLSYLHDYLDACAHAGGRPPESETLTRFLPWSASSNDLKRWRDAPNGPSP